MLKNTFKGLTCQSIKRKSELTFLEKLGRDTRPVKFRVKSDEKDKPSPPRPNAEKKN
jgi:hypothetical protein